MKEVKILVVILLFIIAIMCFVQKSNGASTKFKQPTVKELVAQMKTDVIQSMTRAMMKAETLGKIQNAMEMPCAKVWASSQTVRGYTYWGIKASMEGCK